MAELQQLASELLAANRAGDAQTQQSIQQTVAEIYGNEYARQWAHQILESFYSVKNQRALNVSDLLSDFNQ